MTINSKLAQFYIDEKRYPEARTLLEMEMKEASINEKSHLGDAMVAIATQLGDALAGMKRYADAERAYLKAKSGIDARDANWDKTHWEYWPGQIDDIRPDQLAVRRAAAFQLEGNYDAAMRLLAPILAGPEKMSSAFEDALDIAAESTCEKAKQTKRKNCCGARLHFAKRNWEIAARSRGRPPKSWRWRWNAWRPVAAQAHVNRKPLRSVLAQPAFCRHRDSVRSFGKSVSARRPALEWIIHLIADGAARHGGVLEPGLSEIRSCQI